MGVAWGWGCTCTNQGGEEKFGGQIHMRKLYEHPQAERVDFEGKFGRIKVHPRENDGYAYVWFHDDVMLII